MVGGARIFFGETAAIVGHAECPIPLDTPNRSFSAAASRVVSSTTSPPLHVVRLSRTRASCAPGAEEHSPWRAGCSSQKETSHLNCEVLLQIAPVEGG
jgi:hypothetical protein